MAGVDFAWYPDDYFLNNSRVARFMKKHGVKTGDWRELVRRSMDRDWFWPAILDDANVEWFEPYHTLYDGSQGIPWGKWFLGGKLNIAYNCIERHILGGRGNNIAIYYETNDGVSRMVTYYMLSNFIEFLTGSMRAHGIAPGDRIAMCMPVSTESASVMFACFATGACCVQMAPRLPAKEIIEHLNVTKARMLFIVDCYKRGATLYDMRSKIEAIASAAPSLEMIVVLENRHIRGVNPPISSDFKKIKSLYDFILDGISEHGPSIAVDAETPALMLFSSGTTGTPKRVVHTHGGVLAQVVKEVGYAFDCREEDTFFWVSDFGWMMTPWAIIGTLFFGGSALLYDGDPFYPTSERLLQIIEKYKVNIFGFTPGGIAQLRRLSDSQIDKYNLSSLRILGSTGSVINPDLWQWYFERIGKKKCPIENISGGTEIIGCLLSPLPVMPLKAGTLGTAGLGMNIDVFDDAGFPIRDSKPGYLVCVSPFPSMTRGFYGDQELYLKTYFSKWKDVWFHGDRAMVDADGYWFLLGRADDVIVRNGVKHDPVKIASTLMSFTGKPRVSDAAVIGVPDYTVGERIIAFVVISDDIDDICEEMLPVFADILREHVKQEYDPMGKPDEIFFISAIPRNIAAKVPHSLLKRAFLGEMIEGDELEKISSPEALEEIRKKGEKARLGAA